MRTLTFLIILAAALVVACGGGAKTASGPGVSTTAATAVKDAPCTYRLDGSDTAIFPPGLSPRRGLGKSSYTFGPQNRSGALSHRPILQKTAEADSIIAAREKADADQAAQGVPFEQRTYP